MTEFLTIEKWEGCIQEVKEETFIAHLYKDSKITDIIEAEFNIKDVSENQRKLINKGVIFYWTIGEEVDKKGIIRPVDHIVIRTKFGII
jgi:hypothetical protein